MASDEKIKDEFVVIVYIIERIYVLAITRFPNCTELRINHALFLLDKMKSTQQALIELELAESQKPALDESFMIYRYKKLIDEDILESRKNQNNAELMAEVTLDTHIKEIQQNIEKSTIYYIEFWSQLNEETPGIRFQLNLIFTLCHILSYRNWALCWISVLFCKTIQKGLGLVAMTSMCGTSKPSTRGLQQLLRKNLDPRFIKTDFPAHASDLSKLYEIGTKLNLANLILRDNWKKITKVSPGALVALTLAAMKTLLATAGE